MDKKFCSNCGKEIIPGADVCTGCGKAFHKINQTKISDGMASAIKIISIIGIVAVAWSIIPLFWCIPMYKKVSQYLKGECELSVGFKVCYLLFVSMIPGILLLVNNDEK